MSNIRRWPTDGFEKTIEAQTFICPAPLKGEIRLQLSLDTTFTDIVVDTTNATLHLLVRHLLPSTRYYWRYQHRDSNTTIWKKWSDIWSIQTTKQRWRYLHSVPSDWKDQPNTYRLQNGDFVDASNASNTLKISKNQGATWDSVDVLPFKAKSFSETPGGRLVIRGPSDLWIYDLKSHELTKTMFKEYSSFYGYTSDAMYSAHGTSAMRSTDDGTNWTILRSFYGSIDGIVVEPNGDVLFGLGYWLNQKPGSTGTWIGGMQRYIAQSGAMIQVGKTGFSEFESFIERYVGLRRDADGALYISMKQLANSPLAKSTNNGADFVPIDSAEMRPAFSPYWVYSDLEANQVILQRPAEISRRNASGGYERIDGGLVTLPYRFGTALDALVPLKDGSFLAYYKGGVWALEYDYITQPYRPIHRSYISGPEVYFTWRSVKGTQAYEVEILPLKKRINVSNDTTVFVSNMTAGTYSWRVRPIISGEMRPFSSPLMFTVSGTTSIDESIAGTATCCNSLVPVVLSIEQVSMRLGTIASDHAVFDLYGKHITSTADIFPPQVILWQSGTTRQLLLIVN
ncbi:MAG: hypothetical protein IPH85_08050 [Ignavibacteria bacterium]|nr:hypothetical protein [Ignavibacteria bacterium]MBK6760039.1 hypothetical protein [Ignavibacteria bacterium]MBK7185864.1 hypothetical protein [Ignavibacteria bacterium]MBK7575844.1 hypothetical protein [Ignavibacteria bacterium]